VTTSAPRPWGLTRMRRFPASAVVAASTIVLDPESQTGVWSGPEGPPGMARHKRSETSKETTTRTSLDGGPDEGSDQAGDTD